MIEDLREDETRIRPEPDQYCANCNATEQGFDYQGQNLEIPICRICGMECTKVDLRAMEAG